MTLSRTKAEWDSPFEIITGFFALLVFAANALLYRDLTWGLLVATATIFIAMFVFYGLYITNGRADTFCYALFTHSAATALTVNLGYLTAGLPLSLMGWVAFGLAIVIGFLKAKEVGTNNLVALLSQFAILGSLIYIALHIAEK